MTTIGDDCYFFCTSNCSKGSTCPFRHVEAAKTCRIICQHWQMGACLRPLCKFRHSDFHIQVNSSEVPCYWEAQPNGCKKLSCPYKHSRPRPEQEEAVTKSPTPLSTQEENASSENGSANSTLKFVRPVVNPVVIEPDSEASNSSPIKSADKKRFEEPKEAVTKNTLSSETDKQKRDEENVDGEGKEQLKLNKGPKKKLEMNAAIKKKKAGNKNEKPQNKQKKNSPKPMGIKQKVVPKRISVKERLGNAPKDNKSTEEEESSDSEITDSDDSIENVKVLSMEEIFRQKALESMMKKRAAEGKSMLPEPVEPLRKPVSPRRPPPVKTLRKPVIPRHSVPVETHRKPVNPRRTAPVETLRKPVNPRRTEPVKTLRKPVSAHNKSIKSNKQVLAKRKQPLKREVIEEDEEEESDEDDDETEEEKENDIEENEDSEEETEDDEEDSSGSTTSESSESEEETEAPRRVIIDVDHNVKKSVRRKQVRENLSKRPVVKAKKREVFRESALHEEPPVKKPKNVIVRRKSDLRNRLGKSVSALKDLDSDGQVKRSAIKRKLIIGKEVLIKDPDESEEDRDLGGIKIKTLEQIRAEKAQKLQVDQEPETHSLSPQRKQPIIGIEPIKRTIMLRDEDNTASLSDPGVDIKKLKKRPWKRQKTAPLHHHEEDQRTVSAATVNASIDDFQLELGKYKAHQKEKMPSPESPTENLRRRALLKKAQSRGLVEEPEKSSSKKSKHKHKHKKKSKIERQLYIPPALKSSGSIDDEESVMPSNEKQSLKLTDSMGDAPPKVAPQRAVARRVGALWAAGLNVPSKGLGARIVPKTDIVPKKDFEKDTKPVERKPIFLKVSKKESTDESVTTIKTFSQIMAEKRQKRLQQQTIKANPSSENFNPCIQSESKPRVSVVPILFNTADTTSKRATLSTGTVKTPVQESSTSSKHSFPVKQDIMHSVSGRGNDKVSACIAEKSKTFYKKSSVDLNLDLPAQKNNTQIASSSLTVSPNIEQKYSKVASISPSLQSSSSVSKSFSPTEKDPKRRSMEDEFSFFEEDDFDSGVIPEDAEPIDDLLQDIDDLLA